MSIENGASTGTYVRDVSAITLRDVGKIDGTILILLKTNTTASLKEAGDEMRAFIDRWSATEGHEFMFLNLYLYVDPKDKSKGEKILGSDPLVLEAVKFTWEGCVGSAAAKIEARSQAMSYAASAGVKEPPKSGIAKSLEARKAPPFASYSDKTEDGQWAFIRALTPSLASPLVSVDEARALLGTLMSERGTSFLTSHGCVTADSSVGLLGALMMEVERVDSAAQLRSRIFCADRRMDESLLEFIDRVSDRHQLYCMAFPKALPDHEALLNRVIQCMSKPEYGLQMIMRQVQSLAEARERIRTLNLPSVHDKPTKGRSGGGIYSATAVTSAHGSALKDSTTTESKVVSGMEKLEKQVSEISRAVAANSKTMGQLAMQVKNAGSHQGSGGYPGGGFRPTGPRGGGGLGDLAPNQCYECREYGHFGRDCEKRAARFAAEAKTREATKAANAAAEAVAQKTSSDFH